MEKKNEINILQLNGYISITLIDKCQPLTNYHSCVPVVDKLKEWQKDCTEFVQLIF